MEQRQPVTDNFFLANRCGRPVGARLSIFLGKGGVGRTTLACAFAVDRAAAGERVLLVSIVANDNPTARIQHEAAGVETAGRLELLALDPRSLVDDIVRKITRIGPMTDFILRNPSYESLVDIVPGVREMAIFHFLAKKRLDAFDRIVVDAAATGHGIHFLEAPEKSARILAGPLRTRAEELRAMLQDPSVTDVVLVTLPEEMPVRETLELSAALRRQGFQVDNVVVNKWLPRLFEDAGSRKVLHKLAGDAAARAAFQRAIEGRAGIDVEEWLGALNLLACQRREAREHLQELRGIDAKLSLIPLIPESSQRLLRVAEAMKQPVPQEADL